MLLSFMTSEWSSDRVPSEPRHRSAAISVHCTKSCIYSQKVLLRIGELSSETCRAVLKRLIKRSINGICCIFLVAHIVVLMMLGLTNVMHITGPFLILSKCDILYLSRKEQSFSGRFKTDVNKDIFRRRERKQWMDGENNVIKRSSLFRKRETNYEIFPTYLGYSSIFSCHNCIYHRERTIGLMVCYT